MVENKVVLEKTLEIFKHCRTTTINISPALQELKEKKGARANVITKREEGKRSEGKMKLKDLARPTPILNK